MIRSIPKFLQKGFLFNQRTFYPFCEKIDALKTYLEIIPPHKIYELREKKQHRLENALIKLESQETMDGQWKIDEQALKTVYKQVKRRTSMIPVPVLTRIAQLSCKHEKGEFSVELKKTYSKIIRTVKNGAEKLPLEEMVDLVYKLAKLNKKEYQLMKEVQKVIIEDKIKIDFPLIRKILFAYTHLNQGSSVLYSHISKTLTIGQHEFRPIEMAEAAYMLSKVSENAKGGYGVFSIAQKQLQAILPRLSFGQLVKASSYMLTQDLGSNKFQTKLEQFLYNTYPSKDRVKINDFVALLKSTSGYFFKFKEGALLSLLKTTTLRMTQFATLQQFQDILWSWGRLGKGDKQVWQCLEKQVIRLLPVLKPRQVSFAYNSLCSTQNSSTEVLRAVEERFMKFDFSQMNEHYLIKFLLGMHRKRLYQNEKFIQLSEIVSKKIQKLSNNQFLSFLKILNQSDIDFQTKDKISGVIDSIKKVAHKLQSKLYILKLTQIAELLYLFIKFQIEDSSLINKCFFNLENVINVPKSAFIKTMFSLIIKEKYEKALECVPIVEELTKYGPVGYFFSPFQFPLLAYCIFTLEVKGENIRISKQLLSQVEDALKQINPLILNQFVRKGQIQSFKLIETYHSKQSSG